MVRRLVKKIQKNISQNYVLFLPTGMIPTNLK